MNGSDTRTTGSPRAGSNVRRFASFCYFWLVVGFVLGTAVLVWPVRWLTDALHAQGASQGTENILVILLVAAYVAVSILLARRINHFVCSCGGGVRRWSTTGLATFMAVGTAWTWRQPGRILSGMAGGGQIGAVQTANGAVFEFGAYPDSARLAELKKEHVTVISLQDPDIPVEREGVEEERRVTGELGLPLISAPMVPWFAENEGSLAKLRQIAATGHGHYYVHCGLGRDRVNIVKRLLESNGAHTATGTDYKTALGFDGRAADFDQGSLISLAPGVWLVPHPLKEELYGCFFEGRPGHVVFLYDSTQPPQDSLLRESRRLFSAYGVPFTVFSVPAQSGRIAVAAESAATFAHSLTPPVTIVAYHTPWHDGRQAGDEAAVAFADAYAPNHAWKITTGTVAPTHKANEWTGGKEKGC